jgi:general secretion pathway protein A
MYATYFGFKAPPFQLTPDPSFYFESAGHARALAHLKYGVYQGEGFIVITGEVGSGKTTLVRMLLQGLPLDKIVAAHLTNTQLNSEGLLHAVCTAFGVPMQHGASKAELLALLQHFFHDNGLHGRRTLLVVDEAQHLDTVALEELRMLSNFQAGNHALLQTFIVGQPELREHLQAAALEPLRQRVMASFHLGPIDALETRGYIEHRLLRVGWQQVPTFDDAVFAQVHALTGGIPRKINALCTRVLLGCWVSESKHITTVDVERAAQELHAESSFNAPSSGFVASRVVG